MVRTEEEIRELETACKDILQNLQKDPMKIVRLTGGNVPPAISNIQIMWTTDAANQAQSILAWVLGEENAAPGVIKGMSEKLKGA